MCTQLEPAPSNSEPVKRGLRFPDDRQCKLSSKK